jgi:hypothetical protein
MASLTDSLREEEGEEEEGEEGEEEEEERKKKRKVRWYLGGQTTHLLRRLSPVGVFACSYSSRTT